MGHNRWRGIPDDIQIDPLVEPGLAGISAKIGAHGKDTIEQSGNGCACYQCKQSGHLEGRNKRIGYNSCSGSPQGIGRGFTRYGLVIDPVGVAYLGSQLNLRVGVALGSYIGFYILRSTGNRRKGAHGSYEPHAKCVHLFLLLFISPIFMVFHDRIGYDALGINYLNL